MKTRISKPIVLAAALASLAVTPACSDSSDDSSVEQQEAASTLAVALGDRPDLAHLNEAIAATDLGSVFDGPGSYTLLAPNDAAFEALGASGEALMTEDQLPLLTGLLREHILPGHLTLETIEAAVENQGGEVTVATHGGGTVSFARSESGIVVTSDRGGRATLGGNVGEAENGVVLPIDTVLVPSE